MKNVKNLTELALLTIFGLLLVLISCKKEPDSPVLARVGKSVLTINDLSNNIPDEYRNQITLEQNIDYVKQWMDTELLFQEAMRRKIYNDPLIRERLRKMKKDLLAAEILHRSSVQEQSASIDQKTIRAYYELNKEKFIREKEVTKYLEIVVQDAKTAWYIAKNANRDNFLPLAAEYSQQPFPENMDVPYTVIDEIQPEIRETILTTPIAAVSNPVKSELGYHVIYVIDKLEKGGICKEDEIWEELVSQLTAKSQKEHMEHFLADLRLKTNVEFNTELLKNDRSPAATPVNEHSPAGDIK